MANPEHLAILENGYRALLEWRKQNPDAILDLSETSLRQVDLAGFENCGLAGLGPINLQGADLTDMDLRKIRLPQANLQGASLDRSNLRKVDFSAANLRGASLHFADLDGAELYKADLSGCLLTGANLSRAHFTWTNLDGAILGGSTMANVWFKHCSGLSNVLHEGPSSIGVDTIFRSFSELPEIFLRGCGVPERLITYARSLVVQPIEFYSCFISYSSHDHTFAERLHADLRAKGLRCWFAPEDLKIGDRFQQCIEESIRVFDKVMIVLSEASVQSRWVEREVNAAREREDREKRTVLFPIRIDEAVMNTSQAWAADIRRSRHIGDFHLWEAHASYLKAFERLLRDLRTTDRVSEKPA